MSDLSCACMGIDERTPCDQQATQEDLWCDGCRIRCASEEGQQAKAEWNEWLASRGGVVSR